jgi:exo-1,4-beta-D-glucosaminidase
MAMTISIGKSKPTPGSLRCRRVLIILFCAFCGITAQAAASARIPLDEGWALQSSCKLNDGGQVISSAQYKPHNWYTTTVPSTVLAAQVSSGKFKDPFYGDNLRKIPGTTYPIGSNFAESAMPKDSPYACSWWYRTEFRLPASASRRNAWLHFDGINYRANIWLNGKKLADANDVAGAYRIYEFNATPLLQADEVNVLAVETFAQTENDLGINFVDWAPMPPDKDLGLWRDVYITESGPVTVRYPQVSTHFRNDSLQEADLTITAELYNASNTPMTGTLEAELQGRTVRQNVTLSPAEARSVHFTPQEFSELQVRNPQLWWPAPLGPQTLHQLTMRFLIGKQVSDEQQTRFGIREITAQLNGPSAQPGKMYHIGSSKIVETDTRPLLFRINGKKILIRGAGWTPDLLLRSSPERLKAQFEYVRDMNLNAIRLEGKLDNDDFFDLADQMGVLVIAGWCCCDKWEKWDTWNARDLDLASASLRSQILRLRRHPSLMLWMNGSDFAPPANVENTYIQVLKEVDWPNPYVSSASAMPTSVTGASGVKMTGPYDYEPPSYWLADKDKYGGAFSFMTETGTGPAIPLKGSLEKMIPPDHLWPIDDMWNFHAGAGSDFKDVNHYNDAMKAIYGAPTGLDDYIRKSQAMAYDTERAMFEAYTRNKYHSTGIIQWMLNNAWPSVVWHLYDYYLQPGGGYFGTKKACEPVHVLYSYDDRSVVVANNLYQDFPGLTVKAALYDSDMRENFSRTTTVNAQADAIEKAFVVPEISPAPKLSFLALTLQNSSGQVLSSNFYWLPAKLSTFDWDLEHTNQHAYYSAVTEYEDLTALNNLPAAHLETSASVEHSAAGDAVRVRIHNASPNIAFQVSLGIHDGNRDDQILPVLWQDNYISLLPNESRVLVARYAPGQLASHAELRISGWNISPATILLQPTERSRAK